MAPFYPFRCKVELVVPVAENFMQFSSLTINLGATKKMQSSQGFDKICLAKYGQN